MTRVDGKPTVLVLAPMPAAPTSAGNRRRLVATCEALCRGDFAVDFAYFQHEDQIYRRFGQHPPTDTAAMAAMFQRTFLIPAAAPIPLKTWAGRFPIDAWCPDEAVDFVAWYFATYPDTCAILINYVFLSRCLEAAPPGVRRIIDTHDRFADRQLQYRPFRSEPNFFYTDEAGEAAGLLRADSILAIQRTEAIYFSALVNRDVRLLPPVFPEDRPFRAPRRLARFGFIGHGNDPNLFSISKFAHAWAAIWEPGLPVLVIAGEICKSLGPVNLAGVRLIGYVREIETFYDDIDAVVAPMLMGSGLKIKVAESLSKGCPVIGTRIAFEGFETSHPAHNLNGIADTMAMILSLNEDGDGLSALTAACAALLSRYNATAKTCEEDWLAAIPRGGARRMVAPARSVSETPYVVDLGPVLLSQECSLRSLPLLGEDGGILVATETISPADASTAGYAPERRRWFAREPSADHARAFSPLSPLPELVNVSVGFAAEWVRSRSLGRAAREALATVFGGVRADWTSEGRVVAVTPEDLSVVACVPSFLLRGQRMTAAFVLDAAGKASEAKLVDISALSRSPGVEFTTNRSDLTPVPAAWTFVPFEQDFSLSVEAIGNWPNDPATLLLLSDDLVGRLTLATQQTDLPMDGDEQD